MLESAICDDDIIQQKRMEKLFLEIGLKESINLRKFDSGERLIKSYEAGDRYSIILLDMLLNELDGIQTAEIIRKYDKNCLIIIITSIMEYAVDGYSIDAYHFILKPFDKEKFSRVLNNAIKELQNRMNKTYLIQTRYIIKAKKAVENACLNVTDTGGIILHSDLRTQYTSQLFENYIDQKNMIRSFSRKGNPYDNVCIESSHSVLKKEEIYRHTYKDFDEANLAIFEYIESWYNRIRIHGSIDYMTP
jgi:transposase